MALLLGGMPGIVWAGADDLIRLYAEARERDPVLAGAEARYRAVTEQIPQARAQMLPRVELDAELDRQRLDIGGMETDTFTSYGYGAAVVQPLFDARARPALDASRSRVEAAEEELAAARQDLIVRLVNAYFNVLRAEDDLDTALAQKTAIARQLARAERAFEVGAATVVDVDEAQARFDLARAEEIEAHNSLNVAQQALRRVVGRIPEHLVPLMREPELIPEDFGEMPHWERLALEHARGLRAQSSRLEAARQDVDAARGDRYPRLDATASYRDDRDTIFAGGAGRTDLETTRVGIQLTVPLYQGGGASARIRERAAELEAAREDLTDVRLGVIEATRNAYLQVESGQSRVQALEQALRSSQTSLRSTRRGFEVGVRSSVDVLDALQQVHAAQRDLSAARYELIRDRVTLRDAAGVLDTNDLRALNELLDPEGGVRFLDLPLPLDIPSGETR